MKVAVLADIHLGHHEEFNIQNSRIDNINSAVLACLTDAESKKANIVVFAGDFFDNGKSIDALTLHHAYNIIKFCAKTFKYSFFICGNHDISRYCTQTTLETLCSIYDNTFYVPSDSIKSFEINTKAIDRLLLSSWGADIYKYANDDKKTLFIGHTAVAGALHQNQVMTGISASDLSKMFKLSLLGHFHTPQVLCDNIRYIGTPIQHSFGEVGNDNGYVIFDADKDKWQFISTDSIRKFPKFFKVDASNFETLVLESKLSDPSLDYYWVVCQNETERQEFYEVLKSVNRTMRIRATIEKQVARVTKSEAVGGENVSLVHKMGKYLQKEVSGKYPADYRKAAFIKYREDNDA